MQSVCLQELPTAVADVWLRPPTSRPAALTTTIDTGDLRVAYVKVKFSWQILDLGAQVNQL